MRANDPTNRLFNLRCLATAALLGAAIFVTPSHGQGTPPPPPGGDTGGPSVPPGSKDGDGDFGGEGRRGPRPGGPMGGARAQMQSSRAWMETWKEFKTTVGADVQAKAETIQKEFEAKVKAWQAQHGEEMKALAEKAREAAQSGGAPDKSVMEQMKQLNDSRPKIEEAHKQIFGLLSPEQQEAFKKKLAETEKKMKEQRGGRGEGEGASAGKGGKGGKGGGKPGKGGKPGEGAPPPAGGQGGDAPPPPMDQ